VAIDAVLAATGGEGFRIGLAATGFGFGFRHGIDWDHIAALTDITSSQETSRRSMQLATLYTVGHGAVVFVLGFAAVVFAGRLPAGLDSAMERLVGMTLVVLGVYVFAALVRQGRDFRMRSRWMLVFAGAQRLIRWMGSRGAHQQAVIEHDHMHGHGIGAHHEARPVVVGGAAAGGAEHSGPAVAHRHRHQHAAVPGDPFLQYGSATAFGVGMIHGVGAETPTQVLIFLAASGAGGKAAGVALLGCFVLGLLCSNSLIALASTFGALGAGRHFLLYVSVSVVTATFSLVIGGLFLVGRGSWLPTIFSG
jgi:hypothetical protein